MSGDMWTSLGNGFSNLMLMLFLCHTKGSHCVGVVEGDDGLFEVDGDCPTKEDFANLGWTIKMEEGRELGEMGFCKQYFDLDCCENVVSPAEVLVKTGWTHSKLRFGGPAVRLALLRAKADSILAQYPNAPVARKLADYILRVAGPGRRAYDGGWTPGYWDRACEKRVAPYVPDIRNYSVVERVFGVSVELQQQIERYLDSLTRLQELACPAIDALMKDNWAQYYEKYSADYPTAVSNALM